MSRPKPSTYCTTNWPDDNKAWRGAGRWRSGSILRRSGLPRRRATAMVASLLDLAGPDWPVPDLSTPCRRQQTLTVRIPYRPSSDALHLLIDSSGAKAEGDGEWLARKHGPSRSPEAGSVTHPCCPTCRTGSRGISPSASSPQMAPTTPAPATLLSRLAGQPPSFPLAGTASSGRNTRQERPRATRHRAVAVASAGPSGRASPPSARPSRSAQDRSVQAKGNCGRHGICATRQARGQTFPNP